MMFENENQEWVTHMEKQKTIQQMQAEVDQYIGQFKEGYFSPLAMLARMSEELGELARKSIITMVKNQRRRQRKRIPLKRNWGHAFVLICFANSLGIDLQNSHDLVMGKFTTRDKDRWTRKEEEMEEEDKDE